MLLNLDSLVSKYKLKVNGIIHVGAHIGQEVSIYKKNFGNEIIIHLFEPQSKYFSILQDKFKESENIKIYNYGCGEFNQSLEINQASNEGESSSILNPKLHLDLHPEVKFTGKESIQVKKLDDFKIADSNFISIDVQGYELNVLKGSAKTFQHLDYIYLEVNKEEVYEGCPLIDDIDKYLSKFNFLRVETKFAYDRLPWGDALYIRKSHLNKKKIFASNIKKFVYSVKFVYKIFIFIRKIVWEIKLFFN